MDEYNNNYNNPNTNLYPTPELKTKKRKSRKGSFKKVLKFTAAALIFGILVGAASSGYDYVIHRKLDADTDTKQEETNNDNILATPVNEEETKIDILPTSALENGVVSDVSDVVEKVMPSIVAINSSSTITNYDFFGRRFNEPVKGSGSGIIIAQNKSSILILTNNHVIEGAENVEIVFSDDSAAQASVRGTEASSDLAVLEVSLSNIKDDTLNHIKVANLGDSNQVKAGQMAIAIGNALGYGQSVTVGYISALDRKIDIEGISMNLLQTDAAINPGNSGGALINTLGEVIGINSVKFASQDVEGMGYAIPISDAVPMINQLMNREVIEEEQLGFLGVNLQTAQEVTGEFAQQFNMPLGVYINDVVEDSPAEKAGLKSGYIITKLEGIKIETINELVTTIQYYRAGETIAVSVSFLNDGTYEEKVLNVTLSERP